MRGQEEACAYLVSRYPWVTHAFIVGEVRALRKAGVRVDTASIRRVPDDEVLSPVDQEEHDRTYALLPATAGRVLRGHRRAWRSGRGAYVRTLLRALLLARDGGSPLWQIFYFGEAMMLWAWMRDRGVRHVHVHHANVSADVALLACAFGNASEADRRWTWSMTIHGPTELLDVTAHKLPAKVRAAAAVVCTSDFSRAQVLSFARPADVAKVRTVRCGIDTDAFRLRAPRNGDGRPVDVLCVAAMSARKGHRLLIDAIADLRGQGVDVELTLVGDGDERPRLQAQADALGVAPSVRFTGAVGQDAIRSLYERADIFCLPSFAEGVPTVLMEAMAMELPVVATNVMGVAELVEHGRAGHVVPAARPDLLAAAIAELAADPQVRRRMGAAGRDRVIRDYEVTGAVARLRSVLRPFIVG